MVYHGYKSFGCYFFPYVQNARHVKGGVDNSVRFETFFKGISTIFSRLYSWFIKIGFMFIRAQEYSWTAKKLQLRLFEVYSKLTMQKKTNIRV